MAFRAKAVSLAVLIALLAGCSANRSAGIVPQPNGSESLAPQVLQRGNGAQFQTIAPNYYGNSIWSIAANAYYTYAAIAVCTDPNGSCFEGYTYYARIADDGSITQADSFGDCRQATGQIIAASDNSMWMPDGTYLCRIAPDGSSGQLYPVTQSGQSPFVTYVAAGPDRNLWFNDFNTAQIGKMSLSGTVLAFYKLPSGTGTASSLTAGPDGNLWFTASNVVGKMTTSGQTTKYPVPYAVGAIANPGDGLLYFLYGSYGQNWSGIATIATSGAVHYYPFPGTEAKCDGLGTCYVGSGLTVGPFGNLWFQSPHGIQDFSHSAHTYGAEIATPFGTNSTTVKYAFAYGNDNNLWFYGGNNASGIPEVSIYVVHRMTVTPTSLTLNAGSSATVHASEAYFSGSFLARSSNPSVATVSPSTSTGTFTVTARTKGTATVTIADGPNSSQNNRVNVAVTVK